MNHSAYYQLKGQLQVRKGEATCELCNDMFRCCYRWFRKENRRYIYVILPCQQCQYGPWKKAMEDKQYPQHLEYSHRWVATPVADQMAIGPDTTQGDSPYPPTPRVSFAEALRTAQVRNPYYTASAVLREQPADPVPDEVLNEGEDEV